MYPVSKRLISAAPRRLIRYGLEVPSVDLRNLPQAGLEVLLWLSLHVAVLDEGGVPATNQIRQLAREVGRASGI